jgi:molybdopterin-guanine dinucleotide biosynthesis protein A
MGVDKAFLQLDGVSLLQRAISTAAQVCPTVVLVGEKPKLERYGVVIEDLHLGHGPLAGIHAALKSWAATELNLLLAVDTPAVPSLFLRELIAIAKESGATVTVPRTGGRFQPLCGVYHRDFAAAAESSLGLGRNKIEPLFVDVSTRVLEAKEIKSMGFDADIFDNVNTPDDWRRMQQRFEMRGR